MSESRHLLHRAAVAVALSAVALWPAAGCRSYHCGSLMHPQIRTIAVPPVENASEDPALGSVFRQRLIEQLMADGSLRVVDPADADAVCYGRIRTFRTAWAAAVRARDEDARVRDRDAYQSAVYRAEVTVEFEVRMPNRERPLVGKREVVGAATFPPLPDFAAAKAEGLRQATWDAAARAASAVTEAW